MSERSTDAIRGRRSTDALVRGLARELRPVRRLPRLRTAAAAVVGAWLAALGIDALRGGWGLRLGPDSFWGDPVFAAVALGLAVAAGAGVPAALAAAVPGRERGVRVGRAVALLGLGTAGAAAVYGLGSEPAPALPIGLHLLCAFHACILALAPAFLAGVFLLRGAARWPGAGMALGLGAAALGGLAMHLHCAAPGGLHWLLAHSFGPVAVGTLLGLGLGAALGRRRLHTPAP